MYKFRQTAVHDKGGIEGLAGPVNAVPLSEAVWSGVCLYRNLPVVLPTLYGACLLLFLFCSIVLRLSYFRS